MSNVSQWSTTAASNNSAAPDGWPEGMAPSAVNNSARENMAALAKWYAQTKGALVTTGSSNAYVLSTGSSHAALGDIGLIVARMNHANTGAATLAVDGLTAKSIVIPDGGAVQSGTIAADSVHALVYDPNGDAFVLLSQDATGILPDGHIKGLILSNDTDTDHDINVTAGSARDAADGVNMELGSEITKQIDATWSAGDDAGGLASSLTAPANDTWYHVHLIVVGGSVDVGFDTSITAANLVSDHSATAYRRIGSVLTNGSANIIAFRQDGDRFTWDVVVSDYASTSTTTAANVTLTVPTGLKVQAETSIKLRRGGAAIYGMFTDPDITDTLPTVTVNNLGGMQSGAGANGIGNSVLSIMTNTSAQIRHRTDATSIETRINTMGWVDTRGRLS